MLDVAPQVYRQRLLMEGIHTREMDRESVAAFLLDLARALGLRVYAEPLVYSPSGQGSAANQGFDAFVPLVDSGISAYFWAEFRLASILVYSCKEFDPQAALDFARERLGMDSPPEHRSF